MADSNYSDQTCALCYEAVTESLPTSLTQCCWQPICHHCEQGLVNDPTETFTCLNCQATTVISRRGLQPSLDSFEQLLKKLYDEIAVTAQLRLNQLESQQPYLNQLEVDLTNNMAAIMAAITQLAPSDLNKVTTVVQQFSQAQYKTIVLAAAEYRQLQQQTKAGLRYLAQFKFPPVPPAGQWSAVTLIQFYHDLLRLQQQFNQVLPAVPIYQPHRLFRGQLVLDDYSNQFQGLDKTPRYSISYPDLLTRLNSDFSITDVQFVALVELKGQSADHLNHPDHPIDPPNYLIYPPAHLSCFRDSCSDYWVLVDQTGQVVYHSREMLLAIDSTWLVTLVPDTTVESGRLWLRVQKLAEVLAQPAAYRLFGLNQAGNLITTSPVASTRLDLTTFNQAYDCIRAELSRYHYRGGGQTTHLVIYYDNNPVGTVTTTCEVWALEPVQLLHQHDLAEGQAVNCLRSHSAIVAHKPTRVAWYGTVQPSGHLSDLRQLDYRPISYNLLEDGSLVINRPGLGQLNSILWRPEGIYELPLSLTTSQVHEIHTNPWSGRLFTVIFEELNSGSDDEEGGHGGTDGNGVVMNFY